MSSFKSTAIYLPGVLLPRIGALGLIIVMTHILPKAEYGLLTLVITVGELVDSSLTTWVRLALMRLGAGGLISRELANVVLSSVAVTTALGSAISGLIALVLVPDQPLQFWLAVSGYLLAISLLKLGLALLQVREMSKTYSVLEMLRAIFSFSSAFGIAWLTKASFFWPSLAMTGSTALFALIALRIGYKGLQQNQQHYSRRNITKFAGPLLVLSLMTMTAGTMDRLILQYVWGAAAIGGYAAVYALARQPFDVLANAFNAGGYPALVGHFERGGRTEAATFLTHQLGFSLKFLIPPACVMLLLQNDLLAALLPPTFAPQIGGTFGIVICAAIAFNLRTVIFDNVFHLERQYRIQLCYFIFVFVAALIIGLVAVPRFGMVGAALIFLSWTMLALVMSAFFGRHLIAFRMPWAEAGRAIILAGVSCATVVLMQRALPNQAPFIRLVAEVASATLAYILTLTGLHWDEVARRTRTRLRRTK